MQPKEHKHHKSMPSLSSSISSNEISIQSSPRTSMSCNRMSDQVRIKRWDDSPFEMELAEDDLIKPNTSSHKFSETLRDKFRHIRGEEYRRHKFFKKLYHWFM
ncbi:hypothetical protein G6F70_007015 [Rhizopus microsporus]|uniref:Uncharacterized protein n=2 Tax=Rhizopus TaxID=4842 RepID=A0A367JEF2_RHIAZ|nr:hypothetical protein G6F71_008554 [Rhizopus microsporus]RCH88111.1 hypothetical protein CU097_010622 [Rhizopus azygosporus]KAG1196956.1 hypothetical protein G6F70_007015 [Rhizopus microsporus]KAG1206855.1 hypothetical protein G6F69_008517 [Rhizopus microsporus]KAG1227405.1 hypothetical protein G6F67_008475 [Rhizopus microsporus]